MKKEDLKNGDIVEFTNGAEYVVIDKKLYTLLNYHHYLSENADSIPYEDEPLYSYDLETEFNDELYEILEEEIEDYEIQKIERVSGHISIKENTMRDPNRIEKVLNDIERIWKRFPDLRLGQLLLNVARDPLLYYLEDDELLALLEEGYKEKE
jgi:hypothetical protein